MVEHEPEREQAGKPHHDCRDGISAHLGLENARAGKGKRIVQAKRHQERKQRERHQHVTLVDIDGKRARHVEHDDEDLQAEENAQNEPAHVTAEHDHANQEPKSRGKQNNRETRVERVHHDAAERRVLQHLYRTLEQIHVQHRLDIRLQVEPQVLKRMSRMLTALEVVTAVGRHVVDARPAHRNHRGNEGRQAVGLLEEIAVIVERKRDEGENRLLAGLREETEQRDRQQEVLPGDLVGRDKRIPGHQHGEQANVEDFRRSGTRLQQVYGHTAQEGRRR